MIVDLVSLQFKLRKNDIVNIEKAPDYPRAEQRAEYSPIFSTPELEPPIGPRLLAHYLENLHDTEGDCLSVLEKIPMKLKTQLVVCPIKRESIGWGLYFVDGFNWPKFWTFGFVGLILCTVFGVVWSIVRDDVQGGFGVTACMMVFFTFSAGAVHSALGSP